MYKVGRMWRGKYIFYAGYADFELWTENEFRANSMSRTVAEQIAGAYDANIIKVY